MKSKNLLSLMSMATVFILTSVAQASPGTCVVRDEASANAVSVSAHKIGRTNNITAISVTSYIYDEDINGNIVQDQPLFELKWDVKNNRYVDDVACISALASPGVTVDCMNRNNHVIFSASDPTNELYLFDGSIIWDLTKAKVAGIAFHCSTAEALLGAYTLNY